MLNPSTCFNNRYWYKNGFLCPDMMTVFIPVDETTKQNGCLQVHNKLSFLFFYFTRIQYVTYTVYHN